MEDSCGSPVFRGGMMGCLMMIILTRRAKRRGKTKKENDEWNIVLLLIDMGY
jgi:hypothetical protein